MHNEISPSCSVQICDIVYADYSFDK